MTRLPRSLTLGFTLALLFSGVMVTSGCGKKTETSGTTDVPGTPKSVSKSVAAEADGYAGEAAFALQLRDYPRAAEALSKALKLRDDIPDWWMDYGVVQKLAGNLSEAKKGYQKALALHEKRYALTKEPMQLMPQIHMLLLLSREKDARAVLEKALKAHPSDRHLKEFSDHKEIDRLLQDPYIREHKL
ncbi:MAG TPA: hypothetical protein PLN52_10010 [Opitutaceae bacterium]|nr:hypothetical protein [Opitutaceae bacterium]